MAEIPSIYQSAEWKKAMEASGCKHVDVDGMVTFENTIFSSFGKKKIIFARGSPSSELLEKFKSKAKEYWYGIITPKITNYDDELFKKHGFSRFDDFTIMIDLKKSEKELWNELKNKSFADGIGNAEENKLVFAEAKLEELEKFYSLYVNSMRELELMAQPYEFFKRIYELMVKKGLAKVFVVKKNSEVLAGCVILIDNDHTMLHLTGLSEEGDKLWAMPFLYWNAILYSKKIGKKFIDLGGYDKEASQEDKTYEVSKFKEGFGGKIVAQPVYSTNWRYVFIRRQMRWLKPLKKIYVKEK